MTAPFDPVATATLRSMPERAQAEVLDVYTAVSVVMAARSDTENLYRAIQASKMQFCDEHLIGALAVSAGAFVKMVAEMLGQSVDDVVRNTLKARHSDPTDMEMYDMILEVATTGEMPDLFQDES